MAPYACCSVLERNGITLYAGFSSELGGRIKITMLNNDGFVQATRLYGSSNYSYSPTSIVTTRDGGFAVLGQVNSNGILVIKTDAEGNSVNVSNPVHTALE